MVDAILSTCYSYKNTFVNHLVYSDNFSIFYQNRTQACHAKQWPSPPSGFFTYSHKPDIVRKPGFWAFRCSAMSYTDSQQLACNLSISAKCQNMWAVFWATVFWLSGCWGHITYDISMNTTCSLYLFLDANIPCIGCYSFGCCGEVWGVLLISIME